MKLSKRRRVPPCGWTHRYDDFTNEFFNFTNGPKNWWDCTSIPLQPLYTEVDST